MAIIDCRAELTHCINPAHSQHAELCDGFEVGTAQDCIDSFPDEFVNAHFLRYLVRRLPQTGVISPVHRREPWAKPNDFK